MGAIWSGETKRIAVVGSGVAGLSAAWLLAKRHRVTLFEFDKRLGGHSHTVTVDTAEGTIPVDTGFIVYNERTYPNLTALLDHLRVGTIKSDMSFGASLDSGRVEYSSDGLPGLIGDGRNLFRPRFYRMLGDILRFYRRAPRLLTQPEAYGGLTLGDYLDAEGYSAAFVEDHLLPMGAAIWSTTAPQMRAYPLIAFVRFFASHGLLDVFGQPKWRTVAGGSVSYVDELARDLDVRLSSRIAAIRRYPNHVDIVDMAGHAEAFSDVVIATHADQALALLADPDAEEQMVLGAFPYTDNTAVLHTDPALMPRNRRIWASWNYIGDGAPDDEQQLCVSYWMNRLQRLPTSTQLFVTLNPTRPVAEGKLLQAIAYSHPRFDHRALAAQQRLWCLQGRRRTWFAGSYFGQGFHEDALQSGLAAAEALGGVSRPWIEPAGACRIARAPVLEATA